MNSLTIANLLILSKLSKQNLKGNANETKHFKSIMLKICFLRGVQQ